VIIRGSVGVQSVGQLFHPYHGHLVEFRQRMATGDKQGAIEALAEASVLAWLGESPQWRGREPPIEIVSARRLAIY
jgi:hypothetical protein